MCCVCAFPADATTTLWRLLVIEQDPTNQFILPASQARACNVQKGRTGLSSFDEFQPPRC